MGCYRRQLRQGLLWYQAANWDLRFQRKAARKAPVFAALNYRLALNNGFEGGLL